MDDWIYGIGNEVLVSLIFGLLICLLLLTTGPRLITRASQYISSLFVNNFHGERGAHDGNVNDQLANIPRPNDRPPRDNRDPCPICLAEPPRLALETNCGHIFCGTCLRIYWEMGNYLGAMACPLCRQQVTMLFLSFSTMEMTSETLAEERNEATAMTGLYNRRNSGLPRSWLSYLTDWPILMRHLCREFFSIGGLVLMFRIRIIMCILAGITYLFLPLDVFPEAIFGFLGFLDDIFVLFLLAVYVTIMYRRLVINRVD